MKNGNGKSITLIGAGIGLAAAGIQIRREPVSREQVALAAGLGAIVFAAQAINVPVLPGTSAHLVGGLLLAWMVGPALAAWTMAMALLVQAVVLGDGGLAATYWPHQLSVKSRLRTGSGRGCW